MRLFSGSKIGRAKGRVQTHRPGEMNKAEAQYADHLDCLIKSGEIAAWWFESVKFRIASDRCWYTPDFLVQYPNGMLEIHEIKGSEAIYTDDAKVKVKVQSDTYPFPVRVLVKKGEFFLEI